MQVYFTVNVRQKFGFQLARVVRNVDNAVHWINHYTVDGVVCFVNTYPLLMDGVIQPSNNRVTRTVPESSMSCIT